jgi:CheY-like chemotaxis protein
MMSLDPCILVVDDNPDIRRCVARALTDARYAVLEAEDGALALTILERGGVDIDLVLTDIRMPRLDGVELGRRIAERKWRVPVVYMSGAQVTPALPAVPSRRCCGSRSRWSRWSTSWTGPCQAGGRASPLSKSVSLRPSQVHRHS